MRIEKFIDTESRVEVGKGWEKPNEELLFNGYIVSVGDGEKVLEMEGGDSLQHYART